MGSMLISCCLNHNSMFLLITLTVVSLSVVSAAPESVTNLDQYATDSDSASLAAFHSPLSSASVASVSPSTSSKSKITVYYPNMETQDILVDDLDINSLFNKRGASWNKLQGGWGKRADSWNKLSGGWGKRGPGDRDWNQLSGMWGKRAPAPGQQQSWNNLSGMWGKRGSWESSVNPPHSWNVASGDWAKRGWNDLTGQWGKRDSPHWNNLRGMWG